MPRAVGGCDTHVVRLVIVQRRTDGQLRQLRDRPLPRDRYASCCSIRGAMLSRDTSDPHVRSLPAGDDPAAFVVVHGGGAVGRFALRGIHDHVAGRRLAAAIGGPRQLRFPGPHGLVHDVVIDGAATAHAEAVLAAIAHRALGRLYGAVFFCAQDRGLAGVLRTLGVELPPELAATGIAPVIGVYEPGRAENLARLRAFERQAA